MESKKPKLTETETGMVVTKGWEGGKNEEILIKGYKLPVIRQISFDDLMHNMLIIVTIVLTYLKIAKMIDLKCSHHRKEMEVIEVLVNTIAVTILQYMCTKSTICTP